MKIKSMLLGAMILFAGSAAQAQYLPPIVNDAAMYLIRGCEVKLNVSGWANQLYINGRFVGNYRTGQQDNELANAIQRQLQQGVCAYKSRYEVDMIRDPNLIYDFTNYRYRNCYVKMYASGWTHQFYIYNRLIGNFAAGEEDAKLRSVLVEYIMNGTCVQDNSYPPYPTPYPPYPTPVPQQCVCTLTNQWGNFRAAGPTCASATQAVLNSCSSSNRQAVCSASQVRCY